MANEQNKRNFAIDCYNSAIVNLDHFCIESFKYTTIKQHKEFFNDNNGKVGTKSSIKHRRNANKNHHLKRQPTGKTTRRGNIIL